MLSASWSDCSSKKHTRKPHTLRAALLLLLEFHHLLAFTLYYTPHRETIVYWCAVLLLLRKSHHHLRYINKRPTTTRGTHAEKITNRLLQCSAFATVGIPPPTNNNVPRLASEPSITRPPSHHPLNPPSYIHKRPKGNTRPHTAERCNFGDRCDV